MSMQSQKASQSITGKERVKLATSPNPFLGLFWPSTHATCLALPIVVERMSKTPMFDIFWHFPFQLSPNLDKTDQTTICLDEAGSSQTRNHPFLPKTNLQLQNWTFFAKCCFLIGCESQFGPIFCLLFVVCTLLGPKLPMGKIGKKTSNSDQQKVFLFVFYPFGQKITPNVQIKITSHPMEHKAGSKKMVKFATFAI